MKYEYPCKDCEQRADRCHSTCEKYLEAKAAHKEEREARWKQIEADAYRVRIINRNKKIQIKEKMRKR